MGMALGITPEGILAALEERRKRGDDVDWQFLVDGPVEHLIRALPEGTPHRTLKEVWPYLFESPYPNDLWEGDVRLAVLYQAQANDYERHELEMPKKVAEYYNKALDFELSGSGPFPSREEVIEVATKKRSARKASKKASSGSSAKRTRSKSPIAIELDEKCSPGAKNHLEKCLAYAKKEKNVNKVALKRTEQRLADYRAGKGNSNAGNIKMAIIALIKGARSKQA